LEALIRDGKPAEGTPPPKATVVKVPVEKVKKSPWQPRRSFPQESLADLSQSIRTHGVLQPLLVRPVGSDYELIAGERRLMAATAAGLTEVPVIVMAAADNEALELALIENLQREDLNILDEAEGYQTLADRFSLTQEQIAERVGKARATVANALRIRSLPDEVKKMIAEGQLSAGHAKALIGLTIPEEQALFARRIVTENLSVRAVEKLIQKAKQAPRKPRASRSDIPPNHVSCLSDKLHAHFGTSVRLTPCRTYANGKKGRGSIEIEFYSNDDLDRILQILGVTLD
jgi:ParB family chromosome partitioning protein